MGKYFQYNKFVIVFRDLRYFFTEYKIKVGQTFMKISSL